MRLQLPVDADVIPSVAITPTFTSAGVIALLVVVRTILSFSLELEPRGAGSGSTLRARSLGQ